MKTIETQTIKLEQDEPDSFRLGLCDKTLSLLKSFWERIAASFERISWKDNPEWLWYMEERLEEIRWRYCW